jgi:hypothetical protein
LLIGIRMLTGLGVHGPLDEWVKQCVGPPFTKSLSWRTWLQKTMVYDTYNLKLVTYNYSIQGETKPTKRTEGPTLKVAQVIKRPAGWQTVFLTNSRVCKWVANKCTHCLWLIRMTLLFDGEPPLCLFLWDQPRSGQLDCRIFLVFTGYYIYIIFIILFIHMYILDVYRLYILKKNDIYICIRNVHSMLSSIFLDCILYTIIAHYNNL